MNKPYIICHMMTSLDGRIDCRMTEKLKGSEEYYETLYSFNTLSKVSGRVTAEIEMALPGKFKAKSNIHLNKEEVYKVKECKGYEIILDTKGSLLWNDQKNEEIPILVVTSEEVNKEYLEYLKNNHISYIASGKNKIDLKRVSEILFNEFNVKKMLIVGGGHINAGFLKENLIDEISILLAPGIDGREGMCTVF